MPFSNGLPTWGYWGGPGWAANGPVVDGQRLTPDQLAYPTYDALDALFKQHDIAYDNASALDPFPKQMTEALADAKLLRDMISLPTDSLSADALGYRVAAIQGFIFKLFTWDNLPVMGIRGIVSTLDNLKNTTYRIVWVSDPLALDLDGDGLETVGVNGANSVYFDQDGDGIKNATGWVKGDDGFLVLDRNGNGLIDDGSELFGENTTLGSGAQAAEGFAALSDQDSNQDGVIDASDANFGALRVWRDLNQDGVSQTHELFTLNAAGVQSVNLASTAVNQTLSNGNILQSTASFTRTDGSTGQVADLNLEEDAFYRTFTTAVPVSAAIAALPNMAGSGRLRDLHEAAALSPTLASLLTQYASATTRDQQMALLGDLVQAWVDTAPPLPALQPTVGGSTSLISGGGDGSNVITIYVRRGATIPNDLRNTPAANDTATCCRAQAA